MCYHHGMFSILAALVATSCLITLARWDHWYRQYREWRRERRYRAMVAGFYGDDGD